MDETIQDIKVSYHNITWKSYKNNIPGIEIVRHEPYINLLCSFTPSTDDTLLYHIDWYLDNDAVIQGQIVDKESLQDAILSAEDMINAGKKINSWVQEIWTKCQSVIPTPANLCIYLKTIVYCYAWRSTALLEL